MPASSEPAAEHAVQVYDDVYELARSVAAFLAAGFRAGDPAIVIATAGHWEVFAGELRQRGCEPAALERKGLLTRADAEHLLGEFMDGGLPSAEKFEREPSKSRRALPPRSTGGLAEVVGPVRAARIYLHVAEHVPHGSLPRAQAVLSWISTRDAPFAREVLERARMHHSVLRTDAA
jgi:hypothetical protein